MSRTVLGRVVAILAAYPLALQPITAAALVQVSHTGQVTCSGANPHSAPPASHGQDVACCLSSCCAASVALPLHEASVVLPETRNGFLAASAPAFAPAREPYPRSRAPPAQR